MKQAPTIASTLNLVVLGGSPKHWSQTLLRDLELQFYVIEDDINILRCGEVYEWWICDILSYTYCGMMKLSVEGQQ